MSEDNKQSDQDPEQNKPATFETPEQMADRKTKQALAEHDARQAKQKQAAWQAERDAAHSAGVFANPGGAALANRRMELFRSQVASLVRNLTPEQRLQLGAELRKYETGDRGGEPTPVPLPEGHTAIPPHPGDGSVVVTSQPGDPHAQLQANEAAKIAHAEQGVSLLARAVRTPIPDKMLTPGEVVWQDDAKTSALIDGTHYQKVGEQWQVSMGHIGGHAQARWLSKADAIKAGLEPDPEKQKRDTQLNEAGVQGGADVYHDPLDQGLDWKPAAPHAGAQPVETRGVNERIDRNEDYGL